MKTYAPKGLHGGDLRGLLDDLVTTPLEVSKFLRVTERSVWRWLADGSAPFAVLAALWHETSTGRQTSALDVGNELVIQRGLSRGLEAQTVAAHAALVRLLATCDTGAANDPFVSGPYASAVAPVQLLVAVPLPVVEPVEPVVRGLGGFFVADGALVQGCQV